MKGTSQIDLEIRSFSVSNSLNIVLLYLRLNFSVWLSSGNNDKVLGLYFRRKTQNKISVRSLSLGTTPLTVSCCVVLCVVQSCVSCFFPHHFYALGSLDKWSWFIYSPSVFVLVLIRTNDGKDQIKPYYYTIIIVVI